MTKRSVDVPDIAISWWGSEAGVCAASPEVEDSRRENANRVLDSVVLKVILGASRLRIDSDANNDRRTCNAFNLNIVQMMIA
jgi:hypothetical protein